MEDWKDKGKDKGCCPHGPGGRQDERQSQRGLNLSRARWTGLTGQGEPFLTQPSPLSNDL